MEQPVHTGYKISMDGVFMKIMKNFLAFCVGVYVLMGAASVLSDRQTLNEELIRLHVVANSDTAEDQAIKLQVRDAVVQYLQESMAEIGDVEEAKRYILENIQQIQTIANHVLSACGVNGDAMVTLGKECFDTRYYDTFRLPAGVYESLRISIGDAAGKNWWCVVFPSLCLPATSDGFEAVAAGAGFEDALLGALEGKEPYEVRFYLLDMLGKLENKFFAE